MPVFVLAMIMGLVRPSDITLRNLLVGETMPADYLMRAMGVSRTTADSARIVGALSRCDPRCHPRFGSRLCRGLRRLRGLPRADLPGRHAHACAS